MHSDKAVTNSWTNQNHTEAIFSRPVPTAGLYPSRLGAGGARPSYCRPARAPFRRGRALAGHRARMPDTTQDAQRKEALLCRFVDNDSYTARSSLGARHSCF